MNISNNGTLLAYSISKSSGSFKAVEFLDINNKRVLRDRLPESTAKLGGKCRCLNSEFLHGVHRNQAIRSTKDAPTMHWRRKGHLLDY
jgi:hypothetical protein